MLRNTSLLRSARPKPTVLDSLLAHQFAFSPQTCYLLPMTPKREKFAQAIVSGMNHSDAYRHAYDAENSLPSTITSNAYDLMQDRQVTDRIAELSNAVQSSNLMTRAEGVAEAKTNLYLSRAANQLGPANGALKLATELSGLTQEQPRGEVRVTQVTVVLNHGPSAGSGTVEAESWREVTEVSPEEEQGP